MSDAKQGSPSESSEELEVDEEKLRGDAIGETLFSGKWVLQTVMNLVKEFPKYSRETDEKEGPMDLDPSLEDDLSTLWDMTTNRDVTLFLLSNDIPSILTSLIPACVAPRLLEISVGILGNMVCETEVFQQFCNDSSMLDVVEEFLRNDDSQCVHQSVRFFATFSFHCTEENIPILATRNSVWSSICFILQNSLNEELLYATLNFLHSLLDKTVKDSSSVLKDKVPVSDLTRGIFESLRVSSQLDHQDTFEDLPQEVSEKIRWCVQSLFKLMSADRPACEAVLAENARSVASLLRLFLLQLLESYETPAIVNNCYETLALWSAIVDQAPQLFTHFAHLGYELMKIDIDDREFRALQTGYNRKFAFSLQTVAAEVPSRELAHLLDATLMDHSCYAFQCVRKWAPSVFERLKDISTESGLNKLIQLIQTMEQDEPSC